MSYNGQPTRPRSNRVLSAAPTEKYGRLLPRLLRPDLADGGLQPAAPAGGQAPQVALDNEGSDRLELTHEFVAVMLGTRRAGVTEALGLLRSEGLIDHGRGHITILDAEGLGCASCECYAVLRDEYDRLLSPEVRTG